MDTGTKTALLTVRPSERGLRRGGPPTQSPHVSRCPLRSLPQCDLKMDNVGSEARRPEQEAAASS